MMRASRALIYSEALERRDLSGLKGYARNEGQGSSGAGAVDITPDKQNIDRVFSNVTYYIDFYQREYRWTENR